jgi:Domain of Unknown Function (DUF928)
MTAKSNFRLAGCAFMLSIIVCSGFIEVPGVAIGAPAVAGQNSLWNKIVFLTNKAWQKVSGVRTVGRRQTGIAGGRGSESSDLVALIPEASDKSFVGVTITDRPTFWFYIPPRFTELNLKFMKFTLKDKNKGGKELWSSELLTDSLKVSSGLMPISYKGDKIKANGTYFWELSYQQAGIYQGKERLLPKSLLSGNLQKETFATLPINQTVPDRINTYARNGIWYDLITELITRKQQNPSDRQLANAFRSLIFESTEVKFTKIVDEKGIIKLQEDTGLMESIVTAKVINLPWSN